MTPPRTRDKPSVTDLSAEHDPARAGLVAAEQVAALERLQRAQHDLTEQLKRVGFDGTSPGIRTANERLGKDRRRMSNVLDSITQLTKAMTTFKADLDTYWRDISAARLEARTLREEDGVARRVLGAAVSTRREGDRMVAVVRSDQPGLPAMPAQASEFAEMQVRALESIAKDRKAVAARMKQIVHTFTTAQDRLTANITAASVTPGPEPADYPDITVSINPKGMPPKMSAELLRGIVDNTYRKALETLRPGDVAQLPNKHITIDFSLTGANTIATTNTGGHIRLNPAYYAAHPDDVGSIAHEVVHAVQGYQPISSTSPVWVSEGLADYVRYKQISVVGKIPAAPADGNYNSGYTSTAGLIDWMSTTRDPQIVSKLDTAMRTGTYSDDIFLSGTGARSMDELWALYKSENPPPSPAPSTATSPSPPPTTSVPTHPR